MNSMKALFLIVAATPLVASAQFPGMQMPNTDYFPILLLSPSVQQDMHLSPSVAQQEQGLIIQMGMQMLPMIQQQKGQSSQQRQQFLKQMFKAYENLENKAIQPLNGSQRARLHQLTLQYYGPTALAFPQIAHTVGLTPAQQQKIGVIVSTSGRGMMSHLPHGNGQDMMGQMGAMRRAQNQQRAEAERQVNQVLNSAQRARWNALQGRKLPGVTDLGGLGSMFGGH